MITSFRSGCKQKMAAARAARVHKKNWKDSSGIVLLSGAFKYSRPPTRLSELESLGGNPLIVPLDETGESHQEWEACLVKRSAKTGFFANSYVFPGGRLDAMDSSQTWSHLYKQYSSSSSSSSAGDSIDPFHPILSLRPSQQRLPLYSTVPEGSSLLGEIAFRICAIRELFEEAGVLLVRDASQVPEVSQWLPGTFPPAVKTLESQELEQWRKRVHNNPADFLTLCKELECVPDIWSLIEWSDWLTPRNFNIRYDTLFYLCPLDSQPPVSPDGSEIVDAKWYTPSEAFRLHSQSDIFLTPPQFADMSILRLLGSVSCLHSYALRKVLNGGLSRCSIIRILTKDKVLLSLMASDDLYPALSEELAVTSPPPHLPQSPSLSHIHLHPSTQSQLYEYECPTHTAAELHETCDHFCRLEIRGKGDFQFVDNVLTEQITSHIEDYRHFRNHQLTNSKL